MSGNKEKALPAQGDRTPRSRRGSGMVPATLSSSSNDGFLVPCTPGGAGDDTTGRAVSQEDSAGPSTNPQKEERQFPKVVLERILRPATRTPGASDAAKPMEEEEDGKSRASTPDRRSVGDTASFFADSSGSDVSVRTMASGTAKRNRVKEHTNAPKAKRERYARKQVASHADHVDLTSDEEAASSLIPPESPPGKRETRGRPPTTAEGFLKSQKEGARRELEELEKQKALLDKILDNNFEEKASRAAKKRRQREAEMEAEMRHLPPKDIAAQMVLAARRVEETAIKSGHLKGGFVHLLKEAALSIEVGVDSLVAGMAPGQESVTSLRAEIRALQKEMGDLRDRNTALTREIAGLRGDGASVPGTLTQCAGEAMEVETRTLHSSEDIVRASTSPTPSPKGKRLQRKKPGGKPTPPLVGGSCILPGA